ncbi:hypothetical protein BB347_13645 [Natronorubrum daqingense]|nr:hypothetical protein BB347_13645 [Natronorubrum daqingense]
MDYLPETPDETDESDSEPTSANGQETIDIDETPFTCVPWVTTTDTGNRSLEQAVRVHSHIEGMGEMHDDELERYVEPFTWTHSSNQIDRERVYWQYVAPTVATSSSVEWVGHHGYDESEGFPGFHELKEIAANHLPDRAEGDYATVARVVEKIGYLHSQQNGRRISRWELTRRKTGVNKQWERVYDRYVPMMPQIRPANGRNEPDWKWAGDE